MRGWIREVIAADYGVAVITVAGLTLATSVAPRVVHLALQTLVWSGALLAHFEAALRVWVVG
jgi:hypothetical protein